jgi:hypothetical protein
MSQASPGLLARLLDKLAAPGPAKVYLDTGAEVTVTVRHTQIVDLGWGPVVLKPGESVTFTGPDAARRADTLTAADAATTEEDT